MLLTHHPVISTGIREDNIRRAFNFLDKNGSGALTFDEVSEAVGGDEEASEIFTVVDLNGDGVLSFDEFKALLQGLNFNSPKFRALRDEAPHAEASSDKARRS